LLSGFPEHLKILHVKQEVKGTDATVIEMVINSDIELKLLKDQRDILERMDTEGVTDVQEIGGHAHPSLENLGKTPIIKNQ